jgi:hypothetical protein
MKLFGIGQKHDTFRENLASRMHVEFPANQNFQHSLIISDLVPLGIRAACTI